MHTPVSGSVSTASTIDKELNRLPASSTSAHPRRGHAFRWLLTAQALSLLGDQLLGVALALYVLDVSGSVVLSTASILLNMLPGVALGPVGGAIVDRCDRRRLLMVVSTARALLVLPLLLVTAGWAPVGWVLVVTFIKSSVAQLAGPAVGASLPALVASHDLPRANARLATTTVVLQLTAPAVGAIIYAGHGLTLAVVCNAVAYLAASGAWFRLPGAMPVPTTNGRVWRSTLAGVRLVRRDRLLSRLLTAFAVGLIGLSMQMALLVPFVRLELHGSPTSVGLISSIQAVGALVAALTFTRFHRRLGNLGVVALGMCGLPAATIVFVLSHDVYQAFPGVMASGLLLALLTSAAQVHIQQNVPGHFLGRVLGIISSTIACAVVVGTAIAMLLSVWVPMRTLLLFAVAIELAGVAWYIGPALLRGSLRHAAQRGIVSSHSTHPHMHSAIPRPNPTTTTRKNWLRRHAPTSRVATPRRRSIGSSPNR